MIRYRQTPVIVVGGLFLMNALAVWAQPKKGGEESERNVREGDVPAAALAALKKLAGGAALTEFSEEVEHGHKFYEGSWKGADGKVDGLVTESGDVVELEESIPAEKVPTAARGVVDKEAGKDAKVYWERKTYYSYEAHFRKDGRGREILLSPYGSRHHEEQEEEEGDEDEDD